MFLALALALAPQTVPPAPSPFGTTTQPHVNSAAAAIPDFASLQRTFQVDLGHHPVWDVDLRVELHHTSCGQLDLFLTSPSGRIAQVSTDNGGSFDDVFDGVIFDDSAGERAVDHVYANNVAPATLAPEAAFGGFRYEDANGTWMLTIQDQTPGQTGAFISATLWVTVIDGESSTSVHSFTQPTPFAIPQGPPILVPNPVLGTTGWLRDVWVTLSILHPNPGEIDLELLAPGGQSITLTTDNADGVANAYAQVQFADWNHEINSPSLAAAVTDHYPSPGTTIHYVVPEEALSKLLGTAANGTWYLAVSDDSFNPLTGSLLWWRLEFSTAAGVEWSSYCAPGQTANGCSADLVASGEPQPGSSQFAIHALDLEGQKSGLFFYGLSGSVATPWGSGSTLCVKAPTQRTSVLATGGTSGQCDGAMTLDWSAFQASNPSALGMPFHSGDAVWMQAWFRDPPSTKTTSLTSAIRFVHQ